MRLCMMPVSIFVSHLGITYLVNTFEIYTNLIKLFNFEIHTILFLFKSSIQIFNNIWEYHLNKYIYNSSKKKWCKYDLRYVTRHATHAT